MQALQQNPQVQVPACLTFTSPSPLSQGFPGGASGVCQRRRHKRPDFDPWFGKIPFRRAWQPTPVFLPGESQWTEEPQWATIHVVAKSWTRLSDFSLPSYKLGQGFSALAPLAFIVGIVLCIIGCLAASSAFTHQLPGAPVPCPHHDNRNCPQTLPDAH